MIWNNNNQTGPYYAALSTVWLGRRVLEDARQGIRTGWADAACKCSLSLRQLGVMGLPEVLRLLKTCQHTTFLFIFWAEPWCYRGPGLLLGIASPFCLIPHPRKFIWHPSGHAWKRLTLVTVFMARFWLFPSLYLSEKCELKDRRWTISHLYIGLFWNKAIALRY